MYKEHLYQNLEREIILLKQIAKTIQEKDLDFRPHEKSRSNIELMRYLSGLGANMLRWFIDNDLTPDEWLKIREHQKTLTIENFPARLDEQLATIKRYMDAITEEELLTKEITLPSKEKMILGTAIINAPIKWLASYRLQLFVNLKLNGHETLSTKEAWSVMEV
jgi:hypothetical protein